jgi:hypothetical protein
MVNIETQLGSKEKILSEIKPFIISKELERQSLQDMESHVIWHLFSTASKSGSYPEDFRW